MATVTWVINAYNIIFAVLLVSMGRLADQFGRKRFFVIGMVVFTIGSALCAISWSVEWLIGFRVVQRMLLALVLLLLLDAAVAVLARVLLALRCGHGFLPLVVVGAASTSVATWCGSLPVSSSKPFVAHARRASRASSGFNCVSRERNEWLGTATIIATAPFTASASPVWIESVAGNFASGR